MLRCIAIDDEPLALAQIASYINKVPYLELVGRCRDAQQALEILQQTQVDLMFVDINMPDLNGLDFVRSLEFPPKVIFTTAYSDYAIDGYKVQAVDYLLKPFGLKELEAAADRARLRIESETAAYGFVPQPTSAIEQDGCFFVKNDYRIVRLRFDDIKYIESMGEYVRFFVEGSERPLMPLLSMKRVEDVLPSDRFMRVHRSFIVNLSRVTDISRQRIIFGEVSIPIGDSYKQAFLDYINARSL
ncbi:MAG: response regulator transcription factor [Bacteroidales bacterium]|jgi:two-component system LytT family response regulator|nr:response regulator transcription factor [Bacteroidales bacterium]